jgi:RluA family pseudouridine synthase
VSWRPEGIAPTLRLGLSVAALDDAVLVLEKPAGLAVHAGPLIEDSVAARLAPVFPGAGLAHRLDRGASGLLLAGRSPDALRALARAMEARTIARVYLAIAAGAVERDAFSIDLPLRATDAPRGDQPKTVVDLAAGQPARTLVRVRDRRPGASLLEVRLETGRTHQIRAHLAAVGHPLLGDPRYGHAAANAHARETWGTDRPLLHAWRLAFPHPVDGRGELVEMEAWHEPDFARVFRKLPE